MKHLKPATVNIYIANNLPIIDESVIMEKDNRYLLKDFKIKPFAFVSAENIPAAIKLLKNKKYSPLNFTIEI